MNMNLQSSCSTLKDKLIESADSCSLKHEWMNSIEAANYLRISVKTLMNLTCNGQVPFHKFRGRNRYRVEELRTLMLQKRGSNVY
jgi:excisionase family DNA binding protein